MLQLMQGKITDALVCGDAVVHIFTDDSSYRYHYSKVFAKNIANGTVTFGPIHDTNRMSGASMYVEKPAFKRETTVEESIVDFLCMALCHGVCFTAGSTVQHYVRGQNSNYVERNAFSQDNVIGEYEVMEKVVAAFRNNMRNLIANGLDDFRDLRDLNVTHQQLQVLDYLTSNQLQEIYQCMVKILNRKDGRALGSDVGIALIEECNVAKQNRFEYVKCAPLKKGMHWLRALVSSHLQTFCHNEPTVAFMIEFDEMKSEYKLTAKPSGTTLLGGHSASSSDGTLGPAWNKRKHMATF